MNRDCASFSTLLVARSLAVLDEGEEEDLARHLDGCEACSSFEARCDEDLRRETATETLALPADGWERVRAGLDRARVAATANESIFVRVHCSYCHGRLERDAAVFCASCLTPCHRECFAEHGRCTVQGCGERRAVEPAALPARAPAKAPARPRTKRLVAVFAAVLGGGGIAAAALAQFGDVAARRSIEEQILRDAPPERIADAAARAKKIRQDAIARAANAEAEAAVIVNEEMLKEAEFLDDRARGGTMALLRRLAKAQVHPFTIVGSHEKFSRLFERYASAVAVNGSGTAALLDLPDGTAVAYPEGSFRLRVTGYGAQYRLPKDLVVRGAGKDKTLVTIDGDLSSDYEVTNLTFEDLTIDCNNNYLTDLRTDNPITLHFVRCRIVGFDMGAGGSVMLSANTAAFFAEDCIFEAGYARYEAQYGNIFRVNRGLLARLEGCTFVGPFSSVIHGSSTTTACFYECRFENACYQPVMSVQEGIRFENCVELVATDSKGPMRYFRDLNPAWASKDAGR